MQQVTEDAFKAVLQSAEAENTLRASMGLPRLEVTTKAYGAIGPGGQLVEYSLANSVFAIVLDGVHFTNGL